MRRTAFKAMISLLTLHEAGRLHSNLDRILLLAATAATSSLIALYAYTKVTGRW